MSRLFRMPEFSMVALATGFNPSDLLQSLYDFCAIHGVYHTHQMEKTQPAKAVFCLLESPPKRAHCLITPI